MTRDANSTADVFFAYYLAFTTGNFPVEASNFAFNYDAKWANGGGDVNNPSTDWTLNGYLYQQLGGFRARPPIRSSIKRRRSRA